MFPIVLDVKRTRIMLIGNGAPAVRRLRQLDVAGAQHVSIYSETPVPELREAAADRLVRRLPKVNEFAGVQVVMIVDLDEEKAADIAALAGAFGVLVNVEDRKNHCDFHFPSYLRRGDLLLTVSTGGTSPGLAKTLIEHMADLFGPEWAERAQEIAQLREEWKAEGCGMAEILRRTEAHLYSRGWLIRQRIHSHEDV